MQARHRRAFWALAAALAFTSAASLSSEAKNKPSQDKVAVVNGSVITRTDFDREMDFVQRRLLSMGEPVTESQLSDMKEKTLENLINRELLYQESQKKGIQVDEAAIDEQMKALKERFATEAEFKDVLTKMNQSEASMKSQFRRGMAIQQFIDKEIARKVTVSDKEVRAYYGKHPDLFKQPEQVRASHILIQVDPKAEESRKAEARTKIEKIQEKLHKGEDFSTLAKEFSEGPSSTRGGDLGYFTRGRLVKPFEGAAFALKPGQVSGIVKTNFGYHLIKVMDKKPATVIAYEDINDRLEQYLKHDKVEKEVGLYVQKLKEKAKVERFLPKHENH